jgi:hypothetical protein
MAFRLAFYLCEATPDGVPVFTLSDEPLYEEDEPEEILEAYHVAFHPANFNYLIEEIPVAYLLAKRSVTQDHLADGARFCEEIGQCRIIEVTEQDADYQLLYLEEFQELASPQVYAEAADARAAALSSTVAA